MASSASDQQKDFQLKPLPSAPPPVAPQATPMQGGLPQQGRTEEGFPAAQSNLAGAFGHGPSSNDLVVAGGIVLALAIIFFFVRGGVRRHLIAGRASLSAASSAGWAVFAFLVTLSGAVVFGLFGNLWNLLAFTVPMGALVVVTLVLSIILYNAAARGRR